MQIIQDLSAEEIERIKADQEGIIQTTYKAIAFERQRVCEIILKYIVPPDNDGYWANDLLKDIINQIRGE